jgi:hypothetical protein
VVDDPTPWYEELVKAADRLEAKTKQKRWTGRTGYLIERDFVSSAYAMRKLIDADEVSSDLWRRQIPLRRYDLIGGRPLSPDDMADSYDFENGRRTALSVVEICREILDSGVFAFCSGETGDLFDGVYVASARHKNDHTYLLLASDFIALCCDIGMGNSGPR